MSPLITLALAAACAVAAALTALLVPPVQQLCERRGWLAQPGPRRVHTVPTATVGGIAIVGGIVGALLLTLPLEGLLPALRRSSFEHLRLGLLLCGAAIVCAVSLPDDLRELPAWPRLAVHFIAALVA